MAVERIEQFAPGAPGSVAVVDDRWVFCFGSSWQYAGAYNNNYFSILDTWTQTAAGHQFTGIGQTNSLFTLAAGSNGRAWVVSSAGALRSVTPAGVVTSHGTGRSGPLVATNQWVAGGGGTNGSVWLYDTVSMSLRFSNGGPGRTFVGRLGVIGNRLFGVTSIAPIRVVEISTVNGTILNEELMSEPNFINVRGTAIGDRLYWGGANTNVPIARRVVWTDLDCQSGNVSGAAPPYNPNPNPTEGWTAADNGVLYGRSSLGGGTSSALWLDPNSVEFGAEGIPATEPGRVGTVAVTSNGVWLPDGYPVAPVANGYNAGGWWRYEISFNEWVVGAASFRS